MTPAAKGEGRDAATAVPDDVAALSYEAARDALLDVVRRLESGAETLEESLALWERGEALARHCETWLDGARRRIDAAAGTAATGTAAGEGQR